MLPSSDTSDTQPKMETPLSATNMTEDHQVQSSPEDHIASLQEDMAKLRDQLLRSMAEQENIRRRAEKDVQDMAKYALTDFAKTLLEVMDNFDRALMSLEGVEISDTAVQSFVEGVRLTEAAMIKVLERFGVKKLALDIGQKFDPNFHQAMFETHHDDIAAGAVIQQILPGYTQYERLLRPAMVGVSKGAEKPS